MTLIDYYNSGLNIILMADKTPKHEWEKWQTKRQTQEEFDKLPWNNADVNGYAVIAGQRINYGGEGGYIACIDYDTKNVSEEAKKLGKELLKHFPTTQTEQTVNGGLHLIYITREKIESDLSHHNEAALELLGKNRLIIMASSKGYTRLNDNSPTIIQNLEDMFNKILRQAGIETRRKELNLLDTGLLEGYSGEHPPCISRILVGAEQGERSEYCIRLCSYLVNFRGENRRQALSQLLEWNNENKPPLDQTELKTHLDSAIKHGYVYTCSDEILSKLCCGRENCPLFIKKEDLDLEDKAKTYGAYEWKPKTAEITLPELLNILSTEVKFDDNSKVIIFLSLALAYTDGLQQNSDMTGPPSIGKSYTVKCIAVYFPNEDVMEFMGATPKMFFYDDKIRQQMVLVNNDLDSPIFDNVDWTRKPEKGDPQEDWDAWYTYARKFVWLQNLERKNIIFLDMPNFQLLANLRSTLSHDKKLSRYSTVNRNTMRTDHIYIKGFFSCIFCTCFTKPNVQEIHRFWHLNPEWNEKKEKAVLDLIDRKDQDPDFQKWLNNHPHRLWLKSRVRQIKKVGINEIYIPADLNHYMRLWFDERYTRNIPKKSRDYPRFKSLAKAWALLNFPQRKIETKNKKKILWCNEEDITIAIEIYQPIARASEYGLSMEELEIFEQIVEPLLDEVEGTTIRNIHKQYLTAYKRQISDTRLKGVLRKFVDLGHCVEQSQGRGKPKLYYAIPTLEQTTKQQSQLPKIFKSSKPETNRDKLELLVNIFMTNGESSKKEISDLTKNLIKPTELPELITKMLDEGRLYQPKEGYYKLI